VEWQVKQQGGILGGREINVVRYDNRGSVAESEAGVKKLVEDDKVSAIVFGGTSSAEQLAVCDAADQYQVLYSANTLPPGYTGKFAVSNGAIRDALVKTTAYVITNIVKAKTVAFLASDMDDNHLRVGDIKDALNTSGVKIVYEGYLPVDTQDYSSALTRIKYENPDFLFLDFTFSEAYINVARQVMELGGWGNIKVGGLPSAQAAAIKMPGAEGWYLSIFWFPESTYPASVKFVNDFKQVVGRAPDNNHIYFYMDLWTPIHAMELAGTADDRLAIAQAATSGKLEYDTPMGIAHWNLPGGFNDLPYQLAHVEKGKLVQVPMTQ
jgi:branched-chain amino acid transport system substrate-binding protein